LRLYEEEVRVLISATLVVLLAVIAVYLWFVDLLSSQREFGAFLAAELVVFAMLVYVSTKPDYDSVKKSWMLIGCIALALLLIFPFLLSGGQP
jgi:uncharacterized membrane protein